MAKRAGTKRSEKKKVKSRSSREKSSKTAGTSARNKARTTGLPSNAASVPGFPNGIGLQVQHVDFLTLKLDQVKRFYTEVLGFKHFRQDPKLNYLSIRTTQGASLGFMPPNPQMLGEQPTPREPTLYFLVDNVDRVYAKLAAKGVAFLTPPTSMPWGHRVITTQDPEGRTVMLASEK